VARPPEYRQAVIDGRLTTGEAASNCSATPQRPYGNRSLTLRAIDWANDDLRCVDFDLELFTKAALFQEHLGYADTLVVFFQS
jgi:hypothetical protein